MMVLIQLNGGITDDGDRGDDEYDDGGDYVASKMCEMRDER